MASQDGQYTIHGAGQPAHGQQAENTYLPPQAAGYGPGYPSGPGYSWHAPYVPAGLPAVIDAPQQPAVWSGLRTLAAILTALVIACLGAVAVHAADSGSAGTTGTGGFRIPGNGQFNGRFNGGVGGGQFGNGQFGAGPLGSGATGNG